jgi:hypothetical protein
MLSSPPTDFDATGQAWQELFVPAERTMKIHQVIEKRKCQLVGTKF